MKKTVRNIFCLSVMALLASCGGGNKTTTSSAQQGTSSQQGDGSTTVLPTSHPGETSSNPTTSSKDFVDNELSTASGLTVKFNNKGARISSITWDINGEKKTIGKDGFVVGRCANRIAGAKFTLNDTEYNLTKFSDGSSLHGGGSGMNWQGPFANANWTKVSQDASSIVFNLKSADKDNGYPGNMDMTVTYKLSQAGELSIEYQATSDQDTLCNPTNHLYMTLNGSSSYDNLKLKIDANNYTPLENSLPTGEIAPVANTIYDYIEDKAFDGSNSTNYDDNYVLNGTGYRKVAMMTGTGLGVKVEVYTDRPGLQLYKAGQGQVCLETQMFPDMIHHPEFDSYGTTILRANEEFYSKTAYVFSRV